MYNMPSGAASMSIPESPQPVSPASSSYSDETINRTNVYVRKLPPDATDKDLFDLCQEYGKIVSTKAIIDVETNTCKGYGFVDFETAQSATLAIHSLPSKGYQAQIANLQELDPTNLYIGNLPSYVTERDLDSLFSPYGRVVSTRILRTSIGMSKRMGFARMESHDKCEAVIAAFNGKILSGSDTKDPLVVKYADIGKRKLIPLKLSIDKVFTQGLQALQQQYMMSPTGDQYSSFISPSDQGEAVCMVAPQPPLATYPTLGQGGQFALSAAPLTNFQYPISPSWMQPVILQPSVSPNQFSTTPTIPGYFGTAFAYPMEGSLMPTLTIDNTYGGMAYYQTPAPPAPPAAVPASQPPRSCAAPADSRYYYCGPQLVK